MKKADKVLFDSAKKRVDESHLDEHSKESIGVALEMSAEACNGMAQSEKMDTITQAVFSLTLAVSSFMAQAPEHTQRCVNDAVRAHTDNCAKLIATKADKREAGSSLSFSFKEGIKARGASAIIIAAIVALVFSLYGLTRWQDSKTRAAIQEMFDSHMRQMESTK